jgi:hypothetical protein
MMMRQALTSDRVFLIAHQLHKLALDMVDEATYTATLSHFANM